MKPIAILLLLALAPAISADPAATLSASPAARERVGWVETQTLDLHGWKVRADRKLLEAGAGSEGARALSMLANHLERLTILLPEKQLGQMRGFGIFIEVHHPELAAMQYHPGVEWLVERGYDPKLVKMVHIPRAKDLLSRSEMLKHPAVILHELAHAYHDQVLGFDDPRVLAAYRAAMEKGIYEKSLLFNGSTVKHYATTNEKEYFAESTEAYFYHNDFYPFVRAELRLHDPAAFALMETIWGKVD